MRLSWNETKFGCNWCTDASRKVCDLSEMAHKSHSSLHESRCLLATAVSRESYHQWRFSSHSNFSHWNSVGMKAFQSLKIAEFEIQLFKWFPISSEESPPKEFAKKTVSKKCKKKNNLLPSSLSREGTPTYFTTRFNITALSLNLMKASHEENLQIHKICE